MKNSADCSSWSHPEYKASHGIFFTLYLGTVGCFSRWCRFWGSYAIPFQWFGRIVETFEWRGLRAGILGQREWFCNSNSAPWRRRACAKATEIRVILGAIWEYDEMHCFISCITTWYPDIRYYAWRFHESTAFTFCSFWLQSVIAF